MKYYHYYNYYNYNYRTLGIKILLDLIFGFISILIGLRIILKLFGASTGSSFVRWVYETSSPLISPFVGMFPSSTLTSGSVIEISALFALIFYLIISFVIYWLIDQIFFISKNPRNRVIEHDDKTHTHEEINKYEDR